MTPQRHRLHTAQPKPARSGNNSSRPRSSAYDGIGGEQVEGRRAISELLIARRRRVREVWIAESAEDSDLIDEIVALCAEIRAPVRRVQKSRLDNAAKSEAPQGVIAYSEPLPERSLDELFEPRAGTPPFLLAFDGITDPHNLGSLLRSAECAGVTGVLLPKHRSAHITPTVAKVAAGAIEYIDIATVAGIPSALNDCKKAGLWTVGLDMEGDTSIHDLKVADEPLALVFGSEGSGLSRLARQRCDALVRIPQFGSIDSLNVAASGAVACFEVARRRATG